MDGVRVEDHHDLAEQQPVLGAAVGDDVHARVGGEGAEREAEGGGGVGEPGAVDVDEHSALVGVVADRADLLGGVAGAELGALGDGDGERLGAVLVAPAPGLAVDQLGGELAVRGGDGEQLEAGHLLRGAALVHVDVGGLGGDDRAPAREQRLQRDHVGAGAVEDRVGLGALAEVAAEDVLEVGGVVVLAVGDLVAAVGQRDGGQDLGVDARVVVAGEAAHGGVVPALGVGVGRGGHRGVSHRCCPFRSVAGRFQRSTMVSARSPTSVNPANFALGLASRISGVTRALMTRIAAAARGPSWSGSASPRLRKESARARVQVSAAALAVA